MQSMFSFFKYVYSLSVTLLMFATMDVSNLLEKFAGGTSQNVFYILYNCQIMDI